MSLDWMLANWPDLLTLGAVLAAFLELRFRVRALRRDVDNDKSGRRAVIDHAVAIAKIQETQDGITRSLGAMERAVHRVHDRLDRFAQNGVFDGRGMPQRDRAGPPDKAA